MGLGKLVCNVIFMSNLTAVEVEITGCINKRCTWFDYNLATKYRNFESLFSLKTEVHLQILSTKPFLCDIRGRDICKTKYGSEKNQFKIILSHRGFKAKNLRQAPANWPKMGLGSSKVAPSGPSNRN